MSPKGGNESGAAARIRTTCRLRLGSHAELETQLEVCFRNGYLDRERCKRAWALLVRVGPMLEKLHDSLD
jgi:hypothetical protein